ncbi:MAG: phosphatidylserine decarboxylase [Sandaracinus sp.]|nr:phosphatidylserine decarboxylase [Sandaracinus sp.]
MIDPARLTAELLDVLPRKQISRAMGKAADLRAPRPVLASAIDAFAKAYDIDLSEAIVPVGGFRTFDDFFTRRLKPGVRPVDADPLALVSPADGKVEDLGPVEADGALLVKGKRYTVAELVGDADAAARYAGGHYFIVYLSPRDYHRVHSPVEGPVATLRHVAGTLFPVNSIGIQHVPQLFAVNERVAVEQQSPHGPVTTILVGAIGVGRISVSFDDVLTNVSGSVPGERVYGEDGPPLERAEELGTFHLGSTAIVFVGPSRPMRFVVSPGARVRVGEAVMRPAEAG